MAKSILGLFTDFWQGKHLIEGKDLYQFATSVFSTQAGITATAGGTQAAAYPLQYTINEVATVANVADSVMLPIGLPGQKIVIINDAANSLQVFGQVANAQNGSVGDTIAAHGSASQSATATGVAQAGASVAVYYCFTLGKWKQLLTA